MIIAIIQIPLDGPKRPNDAAVRQSLESTKIFHKVKGLLRKYYLNGETGGGGVYMFDTEENALAWFHDGWADWMEGRFGVRPTLALYDNTVILDNETGTVTVGGEAVSPPWESDAAD